MIVELFYHLSGYGWVYVWLATVVNSWRREERSLEDISSLKWGFNKWNFKEVCFG